MSRRLYTGPQGKLQREFYDQAKAAPRTLHPLPEGAARRLAIRRLDAKGLLELVDDGRIIRWKLKR